MPITWRDDGFFIQVQEKDQSTGAMYWRGAGPGDMRVILVEAIAAEREECALTAEGELMEVHAPGEERIVKSIAEQIRARGAQQ